MPVVKNLMVRAGADFSAITKQSKKAQESMRGMQSSVSRACSKISAAADGLKKAFAALGTVVSFAAITSAAKDAKEAYDAQAEAEAKLARVMRNTMGAANDEISSIKALCSAQQELGVIGDEVQLAGAQELATYLTMSSTLKTLIPVMNDMAAQQYGLSASAESVTSIATMLGKVMNGQTSALSRYGYTFTAAQEAVLKYGDEAQRAAVLAQVVGESVGGMNAALAATPSGRLQQVSNTLGDIKEGFGSAVSTVLTVFLPALNTVCSVLASAATLASKVAQSIANVFGGGAKSAETAVSYTGAAVSAMGELGEETKEAGKAAASLGTYGFDTLQKMSGTSSSGGGSAGADAGETGGAGGGIVETATGAEEAGESVGWLERVLNRLKETAEKIDLSNLTDALDRLKTAAEPLGEALFSGLSWAYENVFEPLAQWTIEDALPGFLTALADGAAACAGPLSGLGTALQPLASSAFEGLKWGYDNIFAPLTQWTVSEALPAFLDLLANSVSACSGPLSDLGAALQPLASSAFEGLKWGYENILLPLGSWVGTQALPAFLDVLSGACELLSSVLDALKPTGQWLWDTFLEPIASWTGGVITTVLETIADLLQRFSDWVSENQGLIENCAIIIGSFFAAWVGVNLASTIVGIVGALTTFVTTGGFATAVTTGLGAAINFLLSPITLVIAAIGAVIAIVVLLVKNWDTVKEAAAKAWECIKEVWSAVYEWFDTNVIQPIAGFFSGLWEGIKTAASSAWEGIVGIWTAVSEWFDTTVIQPIAGFFSGLWGSVTNWASEAWNGIKDVFAHVADWFREKFSAAWQAVKDVFSSGGKVFEGIKDGILNALKSIINALISGINKVIAIPFNGINFALDTIKNINILGLTPFSWIQTIAVPQIPQLANGAVFQGNDPYLAVVNDQKHGVNVETPLTTMIEAMMTALRSVDLLGDIQVDVRAVFDGQLAALARLLRPYFEADAKRVGNRASTSKGVI